VTNSIGRRRRDIGRTGFRVLPTTAGGQLRGRRFAPKDFAELLAPAPPPARSGGAARDADIRHVGTSKKTIYRPSDGGAGALGKVGCFSSRPVTGTSPNQHYAIGEHGSPGSSVSSGAAGKSPKFLGGTSRETAIKASPKFPKDPRSRRFTRGLGAKGVSLRRRGLGTARRLDDRGGRSASVPPLRGGSERAQVRHRPRRHRFSPRQAQTRGSCNRQSHPPEQRPLLRNAGGRPCVRGGWCYHEAHFRHVAPTARP